MNKTPVSILQEMMVKKQTVPNYELIHNGGGTHINVFTYQVSCDGLTATGTGRSKKDAKHEAAQAMLKAIAAHRGYPQLPASPAQSPLRTPLPPTVPEVQRIPPNVPFVNAIGALQDLCAENNLQEPEYVQINDVGPPHAKIFTIQCTVATFKEVGKAGTKKQAKQDAAKKMLHKITDLVADLKDASCSCLESEDDKNKEELSNDTIKARYVSLTKLPNQKKINLGFKLSEYHIKIKNCIVDEARNETIKKLQSLIPTDHTNISEELIEHLLSELKNTLLAVDLNLSVMSLESVNPSTHLVAMKVYTSPDIIQVGLGPTKVEAQFYTLLKLINSMILLLE